MSVSEASRSTLDIPKNMRSRFSLIQSPGSYDMFTASGDVYVEILAAYVTTAGSGFTSISISTDHTVPKSIVASTLLASVVKDASATLVGSGFILPDGKKIRCTVVGTGTGGEIVLVARVSPVTQGGTLI